jgi:hypothetical protein
MEEINPICWYCNLEMTEEQTKSELLCHHFLHTTCFIHVVQDRIPQCELCATEITQVTTAPLDEYVVIRNLYATNADFKKKALKLVKQRNLITRHQKAYLQLIKEKKQEIHSQIEVIKAQLEGLTATKKAEITGHQISKDYMTAKRTYATLAGKLRTEHRCSERQLQEALRQTTGFRKFTPFRNSPHRRAELWRHFYYCVRI